MNLLTGNEEIAGWPGLLMIYIDLSSDIISFTIDELIY